MADTKCDYCEKRVAHPRGDQALNDGWHVADVKVGKDKITVISCKDHVANMKKDLNSIMDRYYGRRKDKSDEDYIHNEKRHER